ncbi:MAG: hypothetical protein AAFR74_08890, partial [Pseudomonadota bacterium]
MTESSASARDPAIVILPWTELADRPTDDRLNETRGLVEALGCEAVVLRAENVRNPTPRYL